MNKSIQLIICLFILAGCRRNPNEGQVELKLVDKSFFKDGCVDNSCATVDFEWVQFEDIEEMNSLNTSIEEKVMSYVQTGETTPSSVEEGSDIFIDEYRKFKEDFPVAEGEWFVKLRGDVLFDSLRMMTLAFRVESYTGGAHGNAIVDLMTVDLKSKKLLTKTDIIIDEPRLLELAEVAFRTYHEVDPEMNLEEAGSFFLPESGFFLPKNMGYMATDFVLYYQPYEIGPYSLGSTELHIPLEKLRGVVRQ